MAKSVLSNCGNGASMGRRNHLLDLSTHVDRAERTPEAQGQPSSKPLYCPSFRICGHVAVRLPTHSDCCVAGGWPVRGKSSSPSSLWDDLHEMWLDKNPSGLLAFQGCPRPDPIVGSRIASLLLTGKAPFADHGQSQMELNVFPKPKKTGERETGITCSESTARRGDCNMGLGQDNIE